MFYTFLKKFTEFCHSNTIYVYLITLQFREDGGDLELVSTRKDSISLRLLGNCSNCEHRCQTFESIKYTIIQMIPEIKNVNIVENTKPKEEVKE